MPRFRLSLFLGLLAFLTTILAANSAGDSVPIKTFLTAPDWQHSDLSLEVLQLFARENETAYWEYLSFLATRTNANTPSTSEAQYRQTMQWVQEKQVVDKVQSSLLKMALSLRSYAPAVQAHYHYYSVTILPHLSAEKIQKVNHENCQEGWIDWNGVPLCTVEELEYAIQRDTTSTNDDAMALAWKSTVKRSQEITILPYDVVGGPEGGEDSVTVVVYATWTRKLFDIYELLQKWNQKHRKAQIRFVIRHMPSKNTQQKSEDTLHLSGYGVELAVKSTEYKVVDDRSVSKGHGDASDADKDVVDAADDLNEERELYEEIPQMKKLRENEILDLGLKTALYVVSANNPLRRLVRVTGSYPQLAHQIAAKSFNKSSIDQMTAASQNPMQSMYGFMQPMPIEPTILLNGMELDLARDDPHSILKKLRLEHHYLSLLTSLGLSLSQSIDTLLTKLSSSSSSGGVFDVRSDAVLWWNDLSKDSRYREYPSTLEAYKQPFYPGRLRPVGLNTLNVLFVLDLSDVFQLGVTLDCFDFIERSVPVRFGLVPLVSKTNVKDHIGNMIAASVTTLLTEVSKVKARDFLVKLWRDTQQGIALTPKQVRTVYDSFRGSKEGKSGANILFDTILQNDRMDDVLKGYREFLSRIQIGSEGALFINGEFSQLDENYQQPMINKLFAAQDEITRNVYGQVLRDPTTKDSDAVYAQILESKGTLFKARNEVVFSSDRKPLKLVPLSGEMLRRLPWITLTNANNDELETQENDNARHGIVVVGDWTKKRHRTMAMSALNYAAKSTSVRVALVSIGPQSHWFDKLASCSRNVSQESLLEAYEAIFNLVGQEKAQDDYETLFEKVCTTVTEPEGSVHIKAAYLNAIEYDSQSQPLNVIINGRVIGPIQETDDLFDEFVWKLLDDYEYQVRVQPIEEKLAKLFDSKKTRDLATLTSAVSIVSGANFEYENKAGFTASEQYRHSSLHALDAANDINLIHSGCEWDNAWFRFSATLNPLSDVAQKWSNILHKLSLIPFVAVEIRLTPEPELKEVSLNRFYKYVFDIEPRFTAETGKRVKSGAVFENIPKDVLLTMGVDVPGFWLVTPISSVHDLDNIKLASIIDKSVDAVYKLRNIIVEGHARDTTTSMPPRGLEFVLGTYTQPNMVDTITMANYGYLQLQANPGVWSLRLRKGRSEELYDVIHVSKKFKSLFKTGQVSENDIVDNEHGAMVVVDGFDGATVFIRTRKKPGKEREELLQDKPEGQDGSESWWGKITSKFTGQETGNKNVTVNIFSVASGHLYERLMSIMMISVRRHTPRVKFWLIEQFLSPTFKEFVPFLAKAYDFDYEFVIYKWPHWLRGQKEKQRTIWAYKILFLDVLFPLSLDRVIFVDADQMVRTDMTELIQMDIHGAPYAYTPFCDNKPEIEGFRFWKHGYWAQHLQGKPYHISALYLVDLRRFRQMAAGDRLRGQYQSLSADPNSLANLDQDLPNNMQHSVPIFSLPQEWLWCETWCADEDLKRAKTIDLCNNPMTKEPKLDRARRILPEWDGIDREVGDLMERFRASKSGSVNDSSKSSPDTKVETPSTPPLLSPTEPGRDDSKRDEL